MHNFSVLKGAAGNRFTPGTCLQDVWQHRVYVNIFNRKLFVLFNIYIFYCLCTKWANVQFRKPVKCSVKSVAHTLIIFEHLCADSFKDECHQSSDLLSLSFLLNKVSWLFSADFGFKSIQLLFCFAQWLPRLFMQYT